MLNQMPEMHRNTTKVKIQAVGALSQTSKPSRAVRKTVQPAKHKIDTVTIPTGQTIGGNTPRNKVEKVENNNEYTHNNKSAKTAAEKSPETNLPRYVSHDEPNHAIHRAAASWQQHPGNKSRSALTSSKQPEDIRPGAIISTTKGQSNSDNLRNNCPVKKQLKSEAGIGQSKINNTSKYNGTDSCAKTNKCDGNEVDKTVLRNSASEIDEIGANEQTTTITTDETNSHPPVNNEPNQNSPVNNGNFVGTQERDRQSTNLSSPMTSPELTTGSLLKSRKSVLSVGSMMSHTSLADRILELRSQSSGSVASLRSSQSQPDIMSIRRGSSVNMVRAGSSKSDTAMDVKAMKKHLPDLVPQDGENSSPVVKRRSKRRILQS